MNAVVFFVLSIILFAQCQNFDNFTSYLPIVKIDLRGQPLNRDWVIADLEIIWNNVPPNHYGDKPIGSTSIHSLIFFFSHGLIEKKKKKKKQKTLSRERSKLGTEEDPIKASTLKVSTKQEAK